MPVIIERPTDKHLRDVLTRGLNWLFSTPQPEQAICQHHGASLTAANRRYSFVPSGRGEQAVVVVDVIRRAYLDPYREHRLYNPIEEDEVPHLVHTLHQLGMTTTTTWNGYPGHSGSVRLGNVAAPTLEAAVARYLQGCPRHRAAGHGNVFCGCGWFEHGRNHLVPPAAERPVHA